MKMDKKVTALSAVLVSLFLSQADAHFGAELLIHYRQQFTQGRVPVTYELDRTEWSCHTVAAFGSHAEFETRMFKFEVVPHNHRMLFNNDSTLPQWLPRWFAEYNGLRTSVPMKLNDIMTECAHQPMSCITDQNGPLQTHAYLRLLEGRTLLVEWVSLGDHPSVTLDPISSDSSIVGTRKALFYSSCRKL